MLTQLLQFLGGQSAATNLTGTDGLELAVAALLVEAARMDDEFGAEERATIERVLRDYFDLTPDAVRTLLSSAEEAAENSSGLFPFTQRICHDIELEDRARIIEMLWQVAYADGALDANEDMLIRRIAGLIHVPDRERANARQRALAKLAGNKS
jgi:uncharacterized tellurite resistance protein B-like protein